MPSWCWQIPEESDAVGSLQVWKGLARGAAQLCLAPVLLGHSSNACWIRGAAMATAQGNTRDVGTGMWLGVMDMMAWGHNHSAVCSSELHVPPPTANWTQDQHNLYVTNLHLGTCVSPPCAKQPSHSPKPGQQPVGQEHTLCAACWSMQGTAGTGWGRTLPGLLPAWQDTPCSPSSLLG